MDAVSKRDEILDYLWLVMPSMDDDEAKVEAAKLLDEYAHELAEELRDNIGRDDYPYESKLTQTYVSGWRGAANRIDPDKEC